MSRDVKVLDRNTGTVLFSTEIENIEQAYEKAEEYENMGLDVTLKAPSIPETLIKSLGASNEDIQELNKVIEDEISSHIDESDMGCSICLPENPSIKH